MMNTSLWKVWQGLMAFTIFMIVGVILYLFFWTYVQNGWRSGAIGEQEHDRRVLAWKAKLSSTEKDLIRDGIHIASGMLYSEELPVVLSSCTPCHSAKLITQNRATREGWDEMIDWMQATQGLPSLGNKRTLILDYLSTFYSPENEGRRRNLPISSEYWWESD